jgi:hypothetical protein
MILGLTMIVMSSFILGHMKSYKSGYNFGSRRADKYWREARMWESKYLDLLMGLRPPDKPDDDRPDDEEDEQVVIVREPVKAIAKAAGAGR